MSGPSDQRPITMNLSLFFILGILVLIAPVVLNIFGWSMPSWSFKAGIGLIVFGIIDMVFLRWAVV